MLNLKRWNTLYFLTLRDTDLDMSLSVTAPAVGDRHAGGQARGRRAPRGARPAAVPRQEGDPDVRGRRRAAGRPRRAAGADRAPQGRPRRRGAVRAVRASARCRSCPAMVGLIVAQQGDAEHDVVSNARARWSAVQFEIRRVTVQGPRAVPEVSAAIAELDRGPARRRDRRRARRRLVRGPAAVQQRVAGARGGRLPHARWSARSGTTSTRPLLDLVADFRASTPTDAAKRIVPDVSEERARADPGPAACPGRADRAGCTREQTGLDHWRSRPVLANPTTLVDLHEHRVDGPARERATRRCTPRSCTAAPRSPGLAAQVRALSPAATLDRGYAVVQRADGHVVRDPADVAPGDPLRIRVARGELAARRSTARLSASPRPTAPARRGRDPDPTVRHVPGRLSPCRSRRAVPGRRPRAEASVVRRRPTRTPTWPRLGYEQARDELVAVVARLEAGAATLEESLALWERGEALATRCQEWLDGARERLSAVRDTAARGRPRTATTGRRGDRDDHARQQTGHSSSARRSSTWSRARTAPARSTPAAAPPTSRSGSAGSVGAWTC